MAERPYKPLTPTERLKKTEQNKATLANTKSAVNRALNESIPGTVEAPATRKEMLDYLNYVLVPALRAIERWLALPAPLQMTSDDRQRYSYVWENTSKLARELRPNRKESDLDFIHALMRATSAISPKEVRVWKKNYSLTLPPPPS
jgi:hypothetical protein